MTCIGIIIHKNHMEFNDFVLAPSEPGLVPRSHPQRRKRVLMTSGVDPERGFLGLQLPPPPPKNGQSYNIKYSNTDVLSHGDAY